MSVSSQLKNKNITTDIKGDTSSNLSTSITIDEPALGMKTIFSFKVPDQTCGKMELQYQDEHVGISTSIGSTANPIVSFSGVVGDNSLALETDLAFDTASGNFTKLNVGLSCNIGDHVTALTLNDNGDSFNASYYHTVSPLTKTAVGAEWTHRFSSNENTLTIGTQLSLDPWTSVKSRVNSSVKASYRLQREWCYKSRFILYGEVEVEVEVEVGTRKIEKRAKIGLALA